jgi:hypothetical protein
MIEEIEDDVIRRFGKTTEREFRRELAIDLGGIEWDRRASADR